MTKEEFMEGISRVKEGGEDSEFISIYTIIPGQSYREAKYTYGNMRECAEAKFIIDDLDEAAIKELKEAMFETLLKEYPDGIENVVIYTGAELLGLYRKEATNG